jgi:YebC/PmpR family DNA-binding regulatory protein
MSGHSKWSTIKRKKGVSDAKKGLLFTKLVREITTAARLGGGDVNHNPRLRLAVNAAKVQRMPNDNIVRAIKKGTGELEGPPVEEVNYEGYGPGGVAFYVEAQTDNRNRTSALVRSTFAKYGGSLGTSGSVAWMFTRRGQLFFPSEHVDFETVFQIAIQAQALDVDSDEQQHLVWCDPIHFNAVLDAFEQAGIPCENAEMTMVCENTVHVAGEQADTICTLMEKLEELDDVQKVYANFELDEEALKRLAL